jgi:hypothetical protein
MTKKMARNASWEGSIRALPVVVAFASEHDVTRGKMMSSYGLKVEGKIFAMFGRGGL